MNNIKLREGVFKKTDQDTYQDGAMTLNLKPIESGNLLLTIIPRGESRVKPCPAYTLIEMRKGFFKIVYAEENFFLEVYEDMIEIRSE